MAIQIIKEDGTIKGRFIALFTTILTFILLILGFCGVECVVNGWERIGGRYETIYLGTLGLWMTTAAAKKIGDVFAQVKEKALGTEVTNA
jgi:hypothetical protein